MRQKAKLRSRVLRYVNAVHAADDRLDSETRAVLIALGAHLSQEDWVVWPSVRRLAKMTKLCERTVKRRRKEIIEVWRLAKDMGSYYGEWRGQYDQDGDPAEPLESWMPRKMRKWRKGGRPPMPLKLDLVALMRMSRRRSKSESVLSALSPATRVTPSPEAMVTGGPETLGG